MTERILKYNSVRAGKYSFDQLSDSPLAPVHHLDRAVDILKGAFVGDELLQRYPPSM